MSSSPRRYRRRLVAVMLGAGLVPLLVLGLASWFLSERVLAVSLSPVEEVLDRVDEAVARDVTDPSLAHDLTATRLELAQAELARRSLRRLAPWGFGAVFVATTVLLSLAAWLLGRALSRRLESLSEGARAYGRGDLAHRLPERAAVADELDVLVQQFNRMGAELEAQRRRLETSEALAAWQEVARTMAHDLKNPLTAMRLSLARLARGLATGGEAPAGRAAELVDVLTEEIDVLARMTESFSDFAKLPAPVARPLELRQLLDDVCGLYREGSPVSVELAPGETQPLEGDADQLRRAFGNLVKNAVEASRPGDAPVTVELARTGESLRVVITDHGPGIPSAIEGPRLVRSLGTTKATGSGLGLPTSYKIFHDHGGTMRLEPGAGGGTRALVTLPIAVGGRLPRVAA